MLEPARPTHPPNALADALAEARAAASRIRAETRGVSLGGAFVACDQPFPVDTDLILWLHPQDPPPRGPRVLRVLARVRWINSTPGELPRGFGVAFRSLTAADEVALHGSVYRVGRPSAP